MAQQYPLPRFHYQVDWGGVKISFTEVTGMDQQVEVIEYRHSDSKDFSKIKMPGMRKYSNITLKRGKFEGDFAHALGHVFITPRGLLSFARDGSKWAHST